MLVGMVGAISAVVLALFATYAVYRTWCAQQVINFVLREHDDDTAALFARYEQEMRE